MFNDHVDLIVALVAIAVVAMNVFTTLIAVTFSYGRWSNTPPSGPCRFLRWDNVDFSSFDAECTAALGMNVDQVGRMCRLSWSQYVDEIERASIRWRGGYWLNLNQYWSNLLEIREAIEAQAMLELKASLKKRS